MKFHVTARACVRILMFSSLVLINACTTAQTVADNPPKVLPAATKPAPTQASQTNADSQDSTAKPLPYKDPKAMIALQRMGEYLRSLKSFTIDSETTIDERLASGQKVLIDGNDQITVIKPDKLHLSRKIAEKGIDQEYFYNGKTFTIFGVKDRFYAAFDAPDTIGKLINEVSERYAIEMPLSDLFKWGTDLKVEAKVLEAYYVGATEVNGIPTDHYAFRNADVDWQLWIEQGDNPLPRKLVITTTQAQDQPQYTATIDWKLNPKINKKIFTFVPPKDAQKIEFVIPESINQ